MNAPSSTVEITKSIALYYSLDLCIKDSSLFIKALCV